MPLWEHEIFVRTTDRQIEAGLNSRTIQTDELEREVAGHRYRKTNKGRRNHSRTTIFY